MLPVVALVALCFPGEVGALTEQEWNTTITELLANRVTAFNSRNISALVDAFAEDAYLMPPGAPMVIGREAIRAGYEARTYWPTIMELSLRDLRFTSENVALAQARGVMKNAAGPGKGLIHVRLVNGTAKIVSYIFNFDFRIIC